MRCAISAGGVTVSDKTKPGLLQECECANQHLTGDPAMSVSIVEALAVIKRNVANCLKPGAIEQACHAENYQWRQRELGPVQTVHAFITQVLHRNAPCAHTVRLARLNCSAEAYCQARGRLPLSVYQRLLKQTSQAAQRSLSSPLWHGHRTFLVDGSSFSMPDTPELQ